MTKEDPMTKHTQSDADNLAKTGHAPAHGKSHATDPAKTVETKSTSTEPDTKKAPTDPSTKVENETDQAKLKAEAEHKSADDHESKAKVAEHDAKLTEARGDTTTVNDPTSAEAKAAQAAGVDAELERRNRANEEGHQANMDAVERHAHEAHAKTEHPGYHTPTGKEDNRNTPVRIDPDGTKHWA
jgi:hypothetical protein